MGCYPGLLMRKLRLREIKWLAQGHPVVRGRARIRIRSVQLQSQICAHSKATELKSPEFVSQLCHLWAIRQTSSKSHPLTRDKNTCLTCRMRLLQGSNENVKTLCNLHNTLRTAAIIIIPLLTLHSHDDVTANINSGIVCVLISPLGQLAMCRQVESIILHSA